MTSRSTVVDGRLMVGDSDVGRGEVIEMRQKLPVPDEVGEWVEG